MKKPSEAEKQREQMRQSIIGLGERSLKKSYYPELQKRISQLEEANEALLNEIRERTRVEERQQQMEMELRQIQKMQAIGTLAGGIAHDFNNILSAIVGYAELARIHIPSAGSTSSDILQNNLEGILKSAGRAKDLVRRILSFSSHHEGDLQAVELSTLLVDTISMLRAMIPKSITIEHKLDLTSSTILANVTQLQQVFMNLGTNAYHAMRRDGGRLTFTLQDTYIHAGDIQFARLDLKPGEYLKVSVTDTGCGMDRKTAERIFDPYFTTKQGEGGTGLGLAMVHGIVTGHQGHVSVNSQVMKGTTFHLYFPKIHAACDVPEAGAYKSRIRGGTEKILLVDDEEDLATIIRLTLENLGYQVTSTTSPKEAAELFSNTPHNFDLVITDMNMPEMNGTDLINILRDVRSNTPIIVCTGFSELINDKLIKEMGRARLLMKPVIIEDLDQAIRTLLDG
ncbi:response regulator [Desulfopila sp. IMCC35008]|uniref:hybrid sensor histidine kinase/response regulator n=1 Tax=Desulfopila sp. IMCC35008 TaxID=2653858 RepID=UPI0013D302D8|nr:response regulator [Desulfopila sp. IMCC35008]